MRKIFVLFSFVLLPVSAFSQYNQGLRAGGRAISLGGSLVVQARDPSAIVWNPALLTGLKDRQMALSVNEPFEFDFASASTFFPLYGTFGAALTQIPAVTGGPIERGTVAWGRRAFGRLSIGGNLNFQTQNDDLTMSTGWGLVIGNQNVGALGTRWRGATDYDMWDRLNVGFAIQDIPLGSRLFDPTGLVGLSYLLPSAGLLLNTGYHFRNDYNSGHVGVGLELSSRIRLFTGVERLNFDLWGAGAEYQFNNVLMDLTYSARSKELYLTFTVRLSAEPKRLAGRHYQRAAQLLKNGDHKASLKELKKYQAYDLGDSLSFVVPSMVAALERKIQEREFKVDSMTTEVNRMMKGGPPQLLRAALILSKILELEPDNVSARIKIQKLRPLISDYVTKTLVDAVKEYDAGRFAEAQSLFRRASLFGDPDSTAQKYLARIEQRFSDRAQAEFLIGLGYFGDRQYADAIDKFNRAKELDPKRAEEFDEYINRAIKLPRVIDSLFTLAGLNEKKGNFMEAYKMHLEVLKLDKNNKTAEKGLAHNIEETYLRGVRMLNSGNYDEARKNFEYILSIKPDYTKASNGLSAIAQANLANSRAEARTRSDSLLGVAQQFATREEYTKALEQVDRATQIMPDYDAVQRYRYQLLKTMTDKAELLFKEGIEAYVHDRYTEALKKLQRVLELNPAHPSVKDYIKQASERAQAIQELP